jgi:C4-dicarboxylate-specific signal transduction histidine kinase
MKLVTMKNPSPAPECESRQLVSDLFHQLSQPLTTLCCSLELALLQTLTAEQYGEVVGHALSQAEKVSSLATAIRELFDAGQAGEGGEVLELRRAVEDAVGDLLPVAESAGVQVCCAPGPECRVWFDAPRLRQGLFHLMGFMIGSGGATVQIELGERGADAILMRVVSRAVVQNAPPPANSDQELLRRLGLGIARSIFEAAGGTLAVERGVDGLSVEVRLLRKEGRSEERQSEALG